MRLPRVPVPALSTLGLSATLLGTLAVVAAAGPGSDTLVGSGKAASSVRTVAAFRGIELAGSIDLDFRVGPTQRVEIVADDNLLPYITTTVRDGGLTIGTARRSMTTRSPMRAIITAPDLSSLAISGSGDAEVEGLANRSFAVSIRGSGDVELRGTTGSLGLSIAGSGDVDADELKASSVAIDVKGSGDVCVHASQSVAATVNGSGDVEIHGRPKNVVRKVNGSGAIRVLR